MWLEFVHCSLPAHEREIISDYRKANIIVVMHPIQNLFSKSYLLNKLVFLAIYISIMESYIYIYIYERLKINQQK